MRKSTNRLSKTLRQLRKEAGLSGTDAAKQAGLSQSKVSRTEVGTFMPTPEQVEALCRVYQASSEQRRELVGMARELSEDKVSSRVVFERGGWLLQERIARIEQLAGRIRNVCPSGVMPGLLQSEDYASALFGESMSTQDRDRTVAARLARQNLFDSDREFAFVLTEGPLRYNIGGAAVMDALLNHVIEVSRRDNVHVGVIPSTTAVTVPILHPFDLYDQRAVLVGTQTATALLTNQRDVAEYEEHWNELEKFVTWGNDARDIIADTAAEHRRRA